MLEGAEDLIEAMDRANAALSYFDVEIKETEKAINGCASVAKTWEKEENPERFAEVENVLQGSRLNGLETAVDGSEIEFKDVQRLNEDEKPSNLLVISLGTFDGNITEWPGFWSRFERLVRLKSINVGEKLAHLQNHR
uniref:Flavodoxin-like domain-containing protein n=1 Tax=Syphacia muris TaxID=451379 RepID=A0A0N5AXR8_9BILA